MARIIQFPEGGRRNRKLPIESGTSENEQRQQELKEGTLCTVQGCDGTIVSYLDFGGILVGLCLKHADEFKDYADPE